MMPVFCDEGVFYTVAGILIQTLLRRTSMVCLYMFHYAKILPHCIGCYISGSGLDDALIEAEVFEKRTLNSIPTEIHYCKACWWLSRWLQHSVGRYSSSPLTLNSMMIWYSCRYFWARRMPKSRTYRIPAGLLTHTLLAYQVHYLRNWVPSQDWDSWIQQQDQENVRPIQITSPPRMGSDVNM